MNRFKIIAAVTGYGLWFVLLYLLLTWITFPWSRIEEQTVVAASDSGWALEIEDIGSAFFGVWAEGVNLQPTTDDQGNPAEEAGALGSFLSGGIMIDEARVGMPMSRLPSAGYVFLSDLLEGKLSLEETLNSAGRVELEAKFWDGTFALDLDSAKEANKIELNAQGINLDDYVLRAGFISADPQGTLRSKGNISWHKEDPKKSAGGVDLFLDSLTIPGLPVVGDVAFSKSEAHLKLSRGRAEFRDTSLEADEVQAVVEGFITLSKNIERSRLSIKLRFKVREDLDPLANAAMMGNTRHKDDDGWYHYQISGTLGKTRFRPSPAAARRGKRKSPPRRTPTSSSDDDSESGGGRTNNPDRVDRTPMDAGDRESQEAQRDQLREERTRRREERKLKREEMMRKRRERQDELKKGDIRGTAIDNEAFALPDDIMMPPAGDQADEEELEPEEGDMEEEDSDEADGDYEDE